MNSRFSASAIETENARDADSGVTPAVQKSAGELRIKEHEWCRNHSEELRAFSGEWIVLEEERVVAHGNDPSVLISEARRQGIGIPYLVHIRKGSTGDAILGL